MGRWEPNTRERLVRAALELFIEQGYEATTVNQIAERAGGLTKTTFFRHFPDKREVLFAAGEQAHGRIVADAIAAAPEPSTPLQSVAAAVDALAAVFTEERREFSAGLRAVSLGNSELLERAALKRAALSEAMADALRKRGVPELAASLSADLGTRAFYSAYDRWADMNNHETLAEITRRTLEELRAAITTLG